MKWRPFGTIAKRLVWIGVVGVAVVAVGVGTVLAGAPVTSGWPAAKARLYDQEQQAVAQARANLRPKLPAAGGAPAVQAAPARQAGVIAMRQGPFPRSTFDVRDVWQGPVGSDWILAYAGAAPEVPGAPPTRGALRLYRESADMHLTLLGTFPAAEGTGPLTVTAESGEVLRLRTDSGTTLSFDLRTHQYQ